MHTSVSASLIALTSLLAVVSASPVTRSQHPYFSVRKFTFSKSTTSSRYTFNVSYPEDIVISPPSGASPTFTIPGFTDSVACTGTYFYSPSETSTVTPINACGTIGDGKTKTVTSKLDVEQGILYLTYTFRATVDGTEEDFVYTATQTGLTPVDATAMEGFNTPAHGPGVTE